jgi:hypothetical protein
MAAEIKATVGVLYIKTYEIVQNDDSYPNLKLNHLEKLDVVNFVTGYTQFIYSQESTNPAFNVPTIIMEKFGIYIQNRIWQNISNSDNAFMTDLRNKGLRV